ncbi:MAG: nucleotide sugar dehydrogenase [Verrucomicrobiota bacterium]
MQKIAIIGQGYVGLPLSLIFSEAGITVFALDIDQDKIDQLSQGKSYIRHIESSRVNAVVGKGALIPSCDFSKVSEVEAVIICVPTPLDTHRQPDMSYVAKTGEAIGKYLQANTTVILESTAYPGATEELLKPILESTSSLKVGVDLHLAFSPEREDPGNPDSKVKTIPKLVGGLSPACLEKATALYQQVIDTVVPVSSCRVAEAAKLTENIFRSVNIALINELKMIYAKMNIDIWEVIEAAKTKPFGFMPFYPGPGLGGHCIPIDPFYLSWKAKEIGLPTRFIELAGEINHNMPEYVVSNLAEALNQSGKPIKSSRILIIGMAYKKNVDDMRESPALVILDMIKEKGGIIEYYDPYIPQIPHTREFSHLQGMCSIKWDSESLSEFDAAIIVTAHDGVDYAEAIERIPVLIDTRNALSKVEIPTEQIWKA